MKLKKYYFNSLLATSILGIFTGCASVTPLQPSAANVAITTSSVSQNCKWMGKVSIDGMRRSMQTTEQHTLVESEAFDILKNQAAQLGANTIVLHENKMTKGHWHSKLSHKVEGTHVFTGDAYRCPGR